MVKQKNKKINYRLYRKVWRRKVKLFLVCLNFILAKIRRLKKYRWLKNKISILFTGKYRHRATAACFIILAIASALIFYNSRQVKAATYFWFQQSWAGGVSGLTANHTNNQTGVTTYSAADASVATGTSLSLLPTATSTIQTSDTDFNAGTLTNTAVSGSGTNASVGLTSALSFTDWSTRRVGFLATSSDFGVYATNSYAYVISSSATGRFYIIDISSPASPVLRSSLPLGYALNGVYVSGNYAYITGSNKLVVIDISSPTDPVIKKSFAITGVTTSYSVKVFGNYAYVTAGTAGIVTIDISSSTNPVKKGSVATNNARGFDIKGIYAYVADPGSSGNHNFKVIDISSSTAPIARYTLTAGLVTPQNVYVQGNYAYLADTGVGLLVFDITNPISPVLKSTYTTNAASGVSGSGNYVYFTNGNFNILDVSSSTKPLIKGRFSGGGTYNPSILGNNAYVADSVGLEAINISSFTSPVLKGTMITNPTKQLAVIVQGSYAFIDESGTSPFTIVDISNSANPTVVQTITTTYGGSGPDSDYVTGNRAYICDGTNGLYIYDISVLPAAPVYKYTISGRCDHVSGAGDLIYITDSQTGFSMSVYNIASSTNPISKGSYSFGSSKGVYGITGRGNYVYTAIGDTTGLKIFDASSTAPVLKGSASGFNSARGISVQGNYAYVIDFFTGAGLKYLKIFDISSPTSPVLKSTFTLGPSSAAAVRVDGNYAYVADGVDGLQIVNIASSTAPFFVGAYTDYRAVLIQDVAISGSYAYMVDGANGFKIVNIKSFSSPGTFTSPVFNAVNNVYGIMTLDTTVPTGTTVAVTVRSSSRLDMSTAPAWGSCSPSTSGLTVSHANNCVIDGDKYFQYQAALSNTIATSTPLLNSATFNYTYYKNGTLTSLPFDTESALNVLAGPTWDENMHLASGTSVIISLRAASTSVLLSSAVWKDIASSGPGFLTPGCATSTVSAATSTVVCANSVIPTTTPAFINGTNTRWLQYRIELYSNGAFTPTVDNFKQYYAVNAPPDITKVIASEIATTTAPGQVRISYDVIDSDTLSGSPANQGHVTPSFEYYDGSIWHTCATFITANATSTVSVQEGATTTHTVIWNAKVDYNNHYLNNTAQIRVTVNDREVANNLDSAVSATFTLDTTNPSSASAFFVVDGRSDSPNTLTIAAPDDTMDQLQMKLSNNAGLTAESQNSDSGNWIAYAATKNWVLTGTSPAVYYQFRDKYGNLSANGAISSVRIPGQPSNIIYQDISNVETSDWREFIAWGEVEEPTYGFKEYDVYSSIDNGGSWELLSPPITDKTINYFIDSHLDTTLSYSYRVVAKDDNNNISLYSHKVTDRPDGQGGSDLTPPVISNILISSTTPESTHITWETDEPSDSTVFYISTTTGGVIGDFTNAPGAVVSTVLDNVSGLGQHSVYLSGLTPGIKYFIQIKSTDPSGNAATEDDSSIYFFITLTGPTITGVNAADIQNRQATIEWETNDSGFSYVYYSTSPTLASPSPTGIGDDVTHHAVTLYGLLPSTTYYFYVKTGAAEDRNIIDGIAEYYSFTTSDDTTPPAITFNPTTGIINLSDNSVQISWSTDEPATSTLEYGLTGSYGTVLSNQDFNTGHTFVLTDLNAGTEYHFKLNNTDANGNSATQADATFMTTDSSDHTSPVITFNPASGVINLSETSAQISWTTNEIATSTLEYGLTASYGTVLKNNNLNINHSFTLTDMDTTTEYHFRLSNADANGNSTTTPADLTFITANSSDNSHPAITDVSASPIYDTTAIINWTTSKAANSLVSFGLVSGVYSTSSSNGSLNVSHALALQGLAPKTKYYYQVTSVDANSNSTSSLEYDFTTIDTLTSAADAAAAETAAREAGVVAGRNSAGGGGVLVINKNDTVSPIISAVAVKDISANSAAVAWLTNEPAYSFVEYGSTDSYGIASVNLKTSLDHAQSLSDLSPNSLYYYRITSIDLSGNLSAPETGSFLTTNPIPGQLALPTSTKATTTEQQAINDNKFVDVLRGTIDFIKQAAKYVSLPVLEASLNEQQSSLQELSGLTPAPKIISGPTIKTWEDMAIISWDTDQKTSSLVAYSNLGVALTDAQKAQVVGNPDLRSISHQVVLLGLQPSTTYNYQLRGSTAIGASINFSPAKFTTAAKTAKVDNYTVDRLADDKTVFKWTSSLPTDTSVRLTPYHENVLAPDEARTINDPRLTSIHEMTVNSLDSGLFYKVDLFGMDSANEILNQTIDVFSTVSESIPLLIEQVKTNAALSFGESLQVQSIISWGTTKPATSKVYYRQGTAKDDNNWPLETQLDASYTQRHLVVTTDFKPGEVYQFQVESVDSNGQKVRSKTYTILTPQQEQSVFQVILQSIGQTFGWVGQINK
jgi:hypothetical protein